MKREYSSGFVVFHREIDDHIKFLMVQGYANYWGFPKGHLETNETRLDTARRELQEETGIVEISIIDNVTFHEQYIIRRKQRPSIEKHVTYFIGEVATTFAERQKSEIKQLGWFDLDFAKSLVVPDRKIILDQAFSLVQKMISNSSNFDDGLFV